MKQEIKPKPEHNIPVELNVEELCKNSIELVEYAKTLSVRQISQIQLMTYFTLGCWIVEEQQAGENRAAYGKRIIKRLSQELTKHYQKGYSEDTIERCRNFYILYKDRISATVLRIFAERKTAEVLRILSEEMPFGLSWSHYLRLMRIDDANARNFYEIEAKKSNWGLRELSRQINSSLYERLLLSRDKRSVKALSDKGHISDRAQNVVKDPYVLEFLGLNEKAEYSESELETRIINHLQEFLLELGKGFAFIGRQVRFTFDEQHFRVDLVFYNRLLKCFVLFNLKVGELTHQDLGQMQMYVNYYDRYEKTDDESPTIGVLLCQKKSDALVELTLPKDSNIYASKYELYLPNKKVLQEKLMQWVDEDSGEDIK